MAHPEEVIAYIYFSRMCFSTFTYTSVSFPSPSCLGLNSLRLLSPNTLWRRCSQQSIPGRGHLSLHQWRWPPSYDLVEQSGEERGEIPCHIHLSFFFYALLLDFPMWWDSIDTVFREIWERLKQMIWTALYSFIPFLFTNDESDLLLSFFIYQIWEKTYSAGQQLVRGLAFSLI
jgi:hypothetical protein